LEALHTLSALAARGNATVLAAVSDRLEGHQLSKPSSRLQTLAARQQFLNFLTNLRTVMLS
jgi:hypothetical protein